MYIETKHGVKEIENKRIGNYMENNNRKNA